MASLGAVGPGRRRVLLGGSHKRVRDSSIFAKLLLCFFYFVFIFVLLISLLLINMLIIYSRFVQARLDLYCAGGIVNFFFVFFAISILFIYLWHNKSAACQASLLSRLTLEAAPCGRTKRAILECLGMSHSCYAICPRRKLNNFPFHFAAWSSCRSCGPIA